MSRRCAIWLSSSKLFTEAFDFCRHLGDEEQKFLFWPHFLSFPAAQSNTDSTLSNITSSRSTDLVFPIPHNLCRWPGATYFLLFCFWMIKIFFCQGWHSTQSALIRQLTDPHNSSILPYRQPLTATMQSFKKSISANLVGIFFPETILPTHQEIITLELAVNWS